MSSRFRHLLVLPVFLATVLALASPPHEGTLLVANKGEHTLGLIDPSAAVQIATVNESGVTGHEVIASPDGTRAFVPIYGSSGVGLPGTDGSTIDVFDIAARKLIHIIDFGHGVRPHCPVFDVKGAFLYVTTELDQSVAIIDPRSFKIVGSIPTGQPESHMLAISPDGMRGYTANVGPGTVSVLDLVARKTLAVIPVTKHIQRISVSPDGQWVFTSDTEKPRLAVIDTRSNKLDRWIDLPGHGYGSVSISGGKSLLIALPGANAVGIVDLNSLKFVKSIPVPAEPQEIVVRPDGKFAYVSCIGANQVAAIHLQSFKVTPIAAGRGADGLAWAR
jgi:DNA-binding beta-propeller fold protein YncE